MAAFSVLVAHRLGEAAARSRVERLLEEAQRNYAAFLSNANGEWIGNRLQFTFLATGLSISGAMVVEEESVHVSGPLPLAAAFFRGRIEQTIRDELTRLLSS